MPLDTLIFDASRCGFPKPRIPHLPILPDCLNIASRNQPAWAGAAHFRHFIRGRFALREAYRLAGIGPGSTLLAPAYHCLTMLDPALALDGDVALYPLRDDLSPDLAALERLVAVSAAPVKAVLATHYFGISQDFTKLATWCEKHDIALVEDCSHMLLTTQFRAPGCGSHGDYVISSPYKFIPSPDGGLLYARQKDMLAGLDCRQPSLKEELRGIAYALSNANEFHQASRTCNINQIQRELTALNDEAMPKGRNVPESGSYSTYYHPAKEMFASLRVSRFIERHANIPAIAARRRHNFHRWLAGVSKLSHCRPLFPKLPENCIPYMFPLYLEMPDPHFYYLMRLGVPVWRWDSIAASSCSTANDYRLHLLHLPCHQSLSDDELDWMIAAIRKVGAGGTASATTAGAP